MALTREEVLRIAKIARISLSEEEIQELLPQFNRILEFLEKVRSLPLIDETTILTTENESEFREDRARSFDDPDAIVSQFPRRKGRYAEVPPNL